MSTIVVVRKSKKGVIASDSLFGRGDLKILPEHQKGKTKIYRTGNSYIGLVGFTIMANVFEDALEKYASKVDVSSRKAIFQTFHFLHGKLKENYFLMTAERENQPVESIQLECLILAPTGIFSVQSYREVSEFSKFWAEGSGLDLALGAMHAVYDLEDDPEKIALAGIKAASEFDKSTGLPAQIFSLDLTS